MKTLEFLSKEFFYLPFEIEQEDAQSFKLKLKEKNIYFYVYYENDEYIY